MEMSKKQTEPAPCPATPPFSPPPPTPRAQSLVKPAATLVTPTLLVARKDHGALQLSFYAFKMWPRTSETSNKNQRIGRITVF
jgi:hypothetical protein